MATKKTANKQFTIGYRINMWVEQPITADSFEDALVIAKSRTADNVLCEDFDIQDENIKVIQIYAESDSFNTNFK